MTYNTQKLQNSYDKGQLMKGMPNIPSSSMNQQSWQISDMVFIIKILYNFYISLYISLYMYILRNVTFIKSNNIIYFTKWYNQY